MPTASTPTPGQRARVGATAWAGPRWVIWWSGPCQYLPSGIWVTDSASSGSRVCYMTWRREWDRAGRQAASSMGVQRSTRAFPTPHADRLNT